MCTYPADGDPAFYRINDDVSLRFLFETLFKELSNMSDFLDYICSWSALKWVAIVLIAGFVGQFGKMLAQVIIRKISLARQNKEAEPIIKPPSIYRDREEPVVSKQSDIRTQEQYPDKKALKIAAKERKKSLKKNK